LQHKFALEVREALPYTLQSVAPAAAHINQDHFLLPHNDLAHPSLDSVGGLDELIGGEQGGGVADKGAVVKVRARLSDRGTDVAIKIGSEERVGVLVRRIRDVAGIPPHTRLKIAYMGKILHDHESLASQGWREKDVVNALVFQ